MPQKYHTSISYKCVHLLQVVAAATPVSPIYHPSAMSFRLKCLKRRMSQIQPLIQVLAHLHNINYSADSLDPELWDKLYSLPIAMNSSIQSEMFEECDYEPSQNFLNQMPIILPREALDNLMKSECVADFFVTLIRYVYPHIGPLLCHFSNMETDVEKVRMMRVFFQKDNWADVADFMNNFYYGALVVALSPTNFRSHRFETWFAETYLLELLTPICNYLRVQYGKPQRRLNQY